MKIQHMFKDDIDRKINGVVKVDQDANDVLVQELNEYVIENPGCVKHPGLFYGIEF